MLKPATPTGLNRRDFGVTIATAAITAGISETAMAEGAADKPIDPVDQIVELIRHQHPHEQLDDKAIAEIRSDVEQHRARSAVLSSFPLTNGDEPGVLFRPFRKD